MKLDVSKITQVRLDSDQYFAEENPKSQIYLHHTAGSGDAKGVSRYWHTNDTRIATAFIIGASGEIVQCFSSKHWAWHLGIDSADFAVKKLPYRNLNKLSVGIEVCNWGPLKQKNGAYYTYVNSQVKKEMVTILDKPFKGHTAWYRYTDEQIESTRQLLVYLCETYNIPKAFRSEIFNIDVKAFEGTPGIYTHNSVRKDKSDIYPCPRMITMLQNL
jgi:N-acetyl-anhydromuramyl-L-alanine amidase AmpD